jgi:hypothetical protein
MAGGPSKHHVDWLGHRLGNRSDNHVLAPEERMTMRAAFAAAKASGHQTGKPSAQGPQCFEGSASYAPRRAADRRACRESWCVRLLR